MKIKWLSFIASSILLFPSFSYAVGLGSIRTQSYLNEVLKAEIPILSVKQKGRMTAALASNADFAKRGVIRDDVLNQLGFSITERQGRMYISVTSQQRVTTPYLNFILRLKTPEGIVLREYAIFLDPAPSSAKTSNKTAQKSVLSSSPYRIQAKKPSTNVATNKTVNKTQRKSNNTGGRRYGPIRQAETLWSIATHTRPTTTMPVRKMVEAIRSANPIQLAKGLQTGSTIVIPTISGYKPYAGGYAPMPATVGGKSTTKQTKQQALPRQTVTKKVANDVDRDKPTIKSAREALKVDAQRTSPTPPATPNTPKSKAAKTTLANQQPDTPDTAGEKSVSENDELLTILNDAKAQETTDTQVTPSSSSDIQTTEAITTIVTESAAPIIIEDENPLPAETIAELNATSVASTDAVANNIEGVQEDTSKTIDATDVVANDARDTVVQQVKDIMEKPSDDNTAADIQTDNTNSQVATPNNPANRSTSVGDTAALNNALDEASAQIDKFKALTVDSAESAKASIESAAANLTTNSANEASTNEDNAISTSQNAQGAQPSTQAKTPTVAEQKPSTATTPASPNPVSVSQAPSQESGAILIDTAIENAPILGGGAAIIAGLGYLLVSRNKRKESAVSLTDEEQSILLGEQSIDDDIDNIAALDDSFIEDTDNNAQALSADISDDLDLSSSGDLEDIDLDALEENFLDSSNESDTQALLADLSDEVTLSDGSEIDDIEELEDLFEFGDEDNVVNVSEEIPLSDSLSEQSNDSLSTDEKLTEPNFITNELEEYDNSIAFDMDSEIDFTERNETPANATDTAAADQLAFEIKDDLPPLELTIDAQPISDFDAEDNALVADELSAAFELDEDDLALSQPTQQLGGVAENSQRVDESSGFDFSTSNDALDVMTKPQAPSLAGEEEGLELNIFDDKADDTMAPSVESDDSLTIGSLGDINSDSELSNVVNKHAPNTAKKIITPEMVSRMQMKLDLALSFISVSQHERAKVLLQEVIDNGDDSQVAAAEQALEGLS